MDPLIADLMQLFEGFDEAYGVYKLTGEVNEKGKQRGAAASLKGQMSTVLWSQHIQGHQGLGVIPINNQSKVKFAAIDIDIYPLDLIALNEAIIIAELPLVVCRTKSGGAHLYIFMRDWTPAKLVRDKMREFAAFLGYGNSEIYPVQSEILVERGDVGQWINMPYFDAYNTMRYALGKAGNALAPEAFVEYARTRMIDEETLKSTVVRIPESLPGGPPCMQVIMQRGGFPEGTRNNGLFNLGVYAMKASPDNWEKLLEDLNNRHMDPPLAPSEVLGVIKSLKKKEYTYTCNAQPMASYCNKTICRTCKFGIGSGGLGLPVFGSLTKVETVPPLWFLDIEGGGRLELMTDDLQSPMKFQLRCMESLNIMPNIAKREVWQALISKLLENANRVSVPAESTPRGMFHQHLEDFLTSRVQANEVAEILLGKPWESGGYYHFRLRDLMAYLDRKKFYDIPRNMIVVHLKENCKGDPAFINIKGKGVNIMRIKGTIFSKQMEPFAIPKIDDSRPY